MFLMNFFVLYQQLILLVNTFLSNVVHFPFPLSTVVGEKDFHGVMFMRERERGSNVDLGIIFYCIFLNVLNPVYFF